VRLLRVAPACQTALDLGPDISSAVSAATATERGWWRLSESARVEVIALLARLIARGVLVEDPPTEGPVIATVGESAESGAGERGE
jgi:hypothetical protein